MSKSIFGLAKDQSHAEKILDRLVDEGFKSEFVSVLIFDKGNQLTRKNSKGVLEPIPESFERNVSSKKTLGHELHSKAPEGAAAGAVAGGVIGGTIGLLAGLGALAIPGLGPFVAAGPILAALGGSGVGGGVGLLIGALTGLGIPEYEAKKYEDQLKAGRVLVSIEAKTDEELDRIKEILGEEGVEEISKVTEVKA